MPRPATWIVVLSGDTLSNPALPITARASGATLSRLVEGIRLHRQVPGSRLVLSGAATAEEPRQLMSARSNGWPVGATCHWL